MNEDNYFERNRQRFIKNALIDTPVQKAPKRYYLWLFLFAGIAFLVNLVLKNI